MVTHKLEIVPAEQKHVDALMGKLREADRNECWSLARITADYALQISFDNAKMCWVALYKGSPVCCFGVGAYSNLSHKGCPWMLATEALLHFQVQVIKGSKLYVKKMLEPFDILENYVDNRNVVAVRWLKWCGFTMEDPVALGPDGVLFRRFYMMNKGASHVF